MHVGGIRQNVACFHKMWRVVEQTSVYHTGTIWVSFYRQAIRCFWTTILTTRSCWVYHDVRWVSWTSFCRFSSLSPLWRRLQPWPLVSRHVA